MNSILRWIIAVVGWIILLIIFGIWKVLDKEIGSSVIVGLIRGALVGGGIFFLYQWAKNNPDKKYYSEKSPAKKRKRNNNLDNLDYLYKIVAVEITNKKFKSGLLAQAISEGGGDEAKSRSIYIKLRVEELNKKFNQQSNKNNILKELKNKNQILNNIGKYIYGFIFIFLTLLIISRILIFVSEPLSDNSFVSLFPLLVIVPLAVITYKKFRESFIFFKKPTPESHVRCPDCGTLVPKENSICSNCNCKLIPQ